MDTMSVGGVSVSQRPQAASAPPASERAGVPREGVDLRTRLEAGEEESKSLVEMMREAREQAEEQRKALEKFYKRNHTNYGDAPLEAYARLARAKNRAQVNSASGYARRRLAQLKQALRQDSDNAPAIRSSIGQLQKALNRAEKKKRDLDRESLLEARRAKSAREDQARQEQRLRLELRRRKNQRVIRESGYLREAEIAKRFGAYATQTQLDLRRQAQAVAAAHSVSPEAAALQYTAAAQAPTPEAPPSVSVSL